MRKKHNILLHIASLVLAVIMFAAFTGCGTGKNPAPEPSPDDGTPALAEKGEIMNYTQYNQAAWLRPIWNTREMYNETVLFVGENDAAPLLYKPSEILSVRSYGLDVEYVEGKDYEITSDGKIRRLSGSDIPYFTTDEYYCVEAHPDVPVPLFGNYAARFPEQRYIKYGEGNTFTSRQIAVTYTHDAVWNGKIPADKSSRIKKFTDKLRAKQDVTAVFYGDSITVGCNASGTEYGGNTAPYTPSYAEMVTEYLGNKFGAKINCVNTAVGGTGVEWGVDNVQQRVVAHSPDLAVLAFGMNDAQIPLPEFRKHVSDMIDAVLEACPDCAVIVVGTSVPNNETEWYYGNQRMYVSDLVKLEDESQYAAFGSVAVADMTTMHTDLLKKKRFRDMTGNNINHPNDFLIRAYAQVLLRTMLGAEFTL